MDVMPVHVTGMRGPADEARRHRTKECVHDEVVEKAAADREQHEVGQQCLHHSGA
jgi:hypothetical protein